MKTEYIGIHLMLAGLSLQVASLVVVLGLAGDFTWACWKRRDLWVDREVCVAVRGRMYFRGFVCGELELLISHSC